MGVILEKKGKQEIDINDRKEKVNKYTYTYNK